MKMVLGVSMILACMIMIFLVPPATAASVSHGVPSLSVFLTSLAQAPLNVAKRPGIGGKSDCSATASCWDGGTVTCSGSTSCTAADGDCSVGRQRGYVWCDSTIIECPNPCPCAADYCDNEEANCASDCYPCSYTFTCSPTACTNHCRCNFSSCTP